MIKKNLQLSVGTKQVQLKLFTIRPPAGQKKMAIIKRWPLQRGFPPAFFHEIKTEGSGVIGINIFLCTSIRMHKKGWDNSFLTILLIMLIIAHMKSVLLTLLNQCKQEGE